MPIIGVSVSTRYGRYPIGANGGAAGYITGTPMDTLSLTVTPGTYSFPVSSYSRQLQSSDDGLFWSNVGQPFEGGTITLSGVTGKYVRVSETVVGADKTVKTNTAPLGPVVPLVALPVLPLATGAKILSLGHSFIQRSAFTNNTGVNSSCMRAAMPWVTNWDHRFNVDMWYDDTLPWMVSTNMIAGSMSGVGGDHIVKEGSAPGTIERTSWVIDRQPGIVYLDIGTNDISSGVGVTSARHVISRLDMQLTLLRKAGIPVVIQTVTDRGAWPEGSAKQIVVVETNEWIKAQATRSGVYVNDLTGLGFNFPEFDTSLFGTDTLHPNPKGGKTIATSLLPILQSLVKPGDTWNTNPTDANLWPSNGLLGTTGTISTTYGTGQVATGHRVVRNTGSATTVVCSKEEIDTSFHKQVLEFTSTGSGTRSGESWRLTYGSNAAKLSSLGVAVGDWLEMLCYVELSPWDAWVAVQLMDEIYNSGTIQASSSGGFTNPDISTQDTPLSEGWSGWIRCMPTLVPVGATHIRLDSRPVSISIDGTKTGSGTIKISKPILRKVPNPRTAWNL